MPTTLKSYKTKQKPIKTNPANKGVTRKRVGVGKSGKIKAGALNKDIAKQKQAVKSAKPGSSARKGAVKRLRQGIFAKVFGMKRGKK